MEAKIITCHYAYNYGAVLQTYALCSYINNLGVSAEVINYRPYYYKGSTKSKSKLKRALRKIIRTPDNIKSEKVFYRFLKKYIPMTREYKTFDQIIEDDIKPDLLIAGSDQIWNPELPNGTDPAFYLKFSGDDSYKISYAASLSTDRLSEKQQQFFIKNLEDFDMISVRERTGKELLEKCGIKDISVVPDPVYLLDASTWSKMAQRPSGISDEKYVFVYAFNRQKHLFEAAKKLAAAHGWRVYSVNTFWEDVFQGTNHYYWNCKPEEFLYLIKNAECIVTNSFHGLSFSLIFNRPVVLYEKDDNGNSRMMDLIENLGLTAHIIAEKGKDITVPELDYDLINQKLREMKNCAEKFLDYAISKAKEHRREVFRDEDCL